MQLQSKNFQTENTFSIETESDLLKTFRSSDIEKVILPANFTFPMRIQSYLTWKEPSGVYTYLVFKMPNWDLPKAVAFKRTASTTETIGGLCSWCHSYGTSEDIALLTVTVSRQLSRSYLICQDIQCVEKIEENSIRAGKNPEKYIADLYHKIEKLFENLSLQT